MKSSNFNKKPTVRIHGENCLKGWAAITAELERAVKQNPKTKIVLSVETYPGADAQSILEELNNRLRPAYILRAEEVYKPEPHIYEMVRKDLGDDPVFGNLSYLNIDDYISPVMLDQKKAEIHSLKQGLILIIGTGASRLFDPDILVYADMSRWEIQQRQRRNEIGNLGVTNLNDEPGQKYKWAFFVDWRVADRIKREIMDAIDFILDTNESRVPKMIGGEVWRMALDHTVRRPFELVPFFDPGPWGGQWMKEVCDLDPNVPNYAWCFNCVPEENSLLFEFDNENFEIPSINLVYYRPRELLGDTVFARFGAEFPIRFDFLDTWEGGNLSLQVHPLTDYIRSRFGWHYTQDESYYLMDAKAGAGVYLGFKDDVDRRSMIEELKAAARGGPPFPAEKYAMKWPAKKHDHFLIPAGTMHCSGKNGVVLEISATPYIFTFKLWDWGRMGLDGKPRPVHIDHGKNVLQFDRTPEWTKVHLINRIEKLAEGDGWTEERTGLHELEFIETRRHWFTKKVPHNTGGIVNVLNLVEGDEVIVESPENHFDPFIVHYAETFIVPAAVGDYTIRPHGPSTDKQCATIKAFIRC